MAQDKGNAKDGGELLGAFGDLARGVYHTGTAIFDGLTGDGNVDEDLDRAQHYFEKTGRDVFGEGVMEDAKELGQAGGDGWAMLYHTVTGDEEAAREDAEAGMDHLRKLADPDAEPVARSSHGAARNASTADTQGLSVVPLGEIEDPGNTHIGNRGAFTRHDMGGGFPLYEPSDPHNTHIGNRGAFTPGDLGGGFPLGEVSDPGNLYPGGGIGDLLGNGGNWVVASSLSEVSNLGGETDAADTACGAFSSGEAADSGEE